MRNGSGVIAKADVSNVLVSCTQAGRFAYVANLADNDLWAYSINSTTGALTPIGSPIATSGLGPTSLVVDPNGQVVCSAGAANTVNFF